MNEIKIFKNDQFGQVRTINKNGEPWFVAADVCRILEIGNPSDAVNRLDEDEKTIVSTEGHSGKRGGAQTINIISEAGLYSLVLGSRKPEAKAFKRWITHEVIPAIRKTGTYMTPAALAEILSSKDGIMTILEKFKETHEELEMTKIENQRLIEENEEQAEKIEELTPKANYFDIVLSCKNPISVRVLAKDYGWSAQRMNEYLSRKHVQYKQNGTWLLYQKYANKGYTVSVTTHYFDNACNAIAVIHTYWTQSGRLFVYNLLRDDGIYPLVELED